MNFLTQLTLGSQSAFGKHPTLRPTHVSMTYRFSTGILYIIRFGVRPLDKSKDGPIRKREHNPSLSSAGPPESDFALLSRPGIFPTFHYLLLLLTKVRLLVRVSHFILLILTIFFSLQLIKTKSLFLFFY